MGREYVRVDPKHPFVGLNNNVCKEPRHYCCYHNVWLSEGDVRKRGCRGRDQADGERKQRCGALKEDHYDQAIEALIRKTRPCNDKGRRRYYS